MTLAAGPLAAGRLVVGTDVLTQRTGALAWVVLALGAVAGVPAALRWLRVCQREHYLPGAALRFAGRWWASEPLDGVLVVVALAGVGLSVRWPVAGLATALVAGVAPLHLSVRGRTAPLRFTRRLRTLAVVSGVLAVMVVVAGALAGVPAPVGAGTALAMPLVVDVACRLLAPIERRAMAPFVDAATRRLAEVAPLIVGITGSYGKTSTKQHLAHLLAGERRVVASPASFNNRGGLARAVNEHLVPGTEVFVAEMGTYGVGEIAELCRWCPPRIAVITAIGPVHLERFGSEERVLQAKSEILQPASVVVLNVDDPRLADLAARVAEDGSGRRVLRCSGLHSDADVAVLREEGGWALLVDGRPVAGAGELPTGVQPSNLACGAAVALELGLGADAVVTRLASLPAVANRLARAVAPSGVVVLDDTFNSNPAGARAALEVLAASTAGGRAVVVTPGMVELGPRQHHENRVFAEAAGRVADLVVVGRTNRRALVAGTAGRALAVRTRPEAVAWVRATLGPGDAVLYENDLPDHYP
ncbi:MAG TPA: UDP-N-acetylmuramoyl-tripeptide--D-alanyl-D-alanine ligase [Acidimicrobiales bacterium]